jgi:APA family basic amino acid/polyamine antiporter
VADAGLERRLGTADATFLGVGSMVGAGVFAAFAPAAAAAGSWLLLALALAALVAYANATASAQLAARYPTSGGTYQYGRERLGDWPGFVAGWGFVVGKTASCAAMALTFAAYAVPPGVPAAGIWRRAVAVVAVVALATVNYRGVTRTARLTRVLVTVVLLALAFAVVVAAVRPAAPSTTSPFDGYGVFQAAGLLFFAFAGYARIATMGEEVREPRTTIPRAIRLALALAVVVYALVALALLHALGPAGLARAGTPVAAAVHASWAQPVVRVGAAAGALGALLALIAGIGRTVLAMARQRDVPDWLAAVHPRYRTPHRAEVALAVVVCVLVLTVDLRGAIGFSSFGVLVYYFIANAAAFTQTGADRRYPRAFQIGGMAGCALLCVTLPWTAVAIGVAVSAGGTAYRAILLRMRRRRSKPDSR